MRKFCQTLDKQEKSYDKYSSIHNTKNSERH